MCVSTRKGSLISLPAVFHSILPPPTLRPRPFELILEAPEAPPAYLKEAAFVLALQTTLSEYRKFIAYASNL